MREVLRYLEIEEGISIHHDGDIPARSGMGSSSAFTVGLLNGMMALKGRHISKQELAMTAIYIEQQLIKENVGSQDQMFAAHGGFNLIEFKTSGEIICSPLIIPMSRYKQLEESLMLFFTGLSRDASQIAKEQIDNIGDKLGQLEHMKNMVDQAAAILSDPAQDLRQFGELLNYAWLYKKELSSRISNQLIDEMYDAARRSGAIGGKLLGAGGGGFMLLFVEKDRQPAVREALRAYLHIPFQFDFDGSKIIVYQPNY